MRAILVVGVAVAAVAATAQAGSLAFMQLRQRRIRDEPRLDRYTGKILEFDGNSGHGAPEVSEITRPIDGRVTFRNRSEGRP